MRLGADARPGKVTLNPARTVQHKTEHNERIRFLSVEEEKRLRGAILAKCPERLPEFERALQTGMRLSEQYGARWEDVDFERRLLTIPQDKGGRTSYVQLNDTSLSTLARLRQRTGETGMVCSWAKGPRHWSKEALKDAGITDFSWHCLRHTFASRLIMSGADVRTVAELLRDPTLEMVMRYAHLAADYKLEAMRRMERCFQLQTDTTIAPEPRRDSALVH
jgi:site-specific recombinase XerD